jgi:hypothetical protein
MRSMAKMCLIIASQEGDACQGRVKENPTGIFEHWDGTTGQKAVCWRWQSGWAIKRKSEDIFSRDNHLPLDIC